VTPQGDVTWTVNVVGRFTETDKTFKYSGTIGFRKISEKTPGGYSGNRYKCIIQVLILLHQ